MAFASKVARAAGLKIARIAVRQYCGLWLGVTGDDNVPVTRPPGGKSKSSFHDTINSSSKLNSPIPKSYRGNNPCALILLTPPDRPTRRASAAKKVEFGHPRPTRAQHGDFLGSETPSDRPTSAQTWDADPTFNFASPERAARKLRITRVYL